MQPNLLGIAEEAEEERNRSASGVRTCPPIAFAFPTAHMVDLDQGFILSDIRKITDFQNRGFSAPYYPGYVAFSSQRPWIRVPESGEYAGPAARKALEYMPVKYRRGAWLHRDTSSLISRLA